MRLSDQITNPNYWPRNLLPTLTVHGNNNRKGISKKAGDGLTTAVKGLLPTLTKSTATLADMEQALTAGNHPLRKNYQESKELSQLSQLLPTLRASEYKGCGPRGSASHQHRLDHDYLSAQIQQIADSDAQLEPRFCEWLMGYAVGWTFLPTSLLRQLKNVPEPTVSAVSETP
jgi:hypothetical protein